MGRNTDSISTKAHLPYSFDHCGRNSVWKSCFYWHPKSLNFLLPLWLPLTSILFLEYTIQCKQFRCIYLKSFLDFLSISQIYINFWTFSRNDQPHTLCISWITDPKEAITKMSKKSCLRWHVNRQHGKWTEILIQSYVSTFTIFIDHCEEKWVGKSRFYEFF